MSKLEETSNQLSTALKRFWEKLYMKQRDVDPEAHRILTERPWDFVDNEQDKEQLSEREKETCEQKHGTPSK